MKKETKESKEKESRDVKIAELTESLQRLQAEFENFKKRTDKEKAHIAKYGKAELMVQLLPILDSFELALQNKEDNEKFVHGVEIITKELMKTLKQEGLEEIQAKGKSNPDYHEVVLTEKSDKEDEILAVLQKGYMLHDRVLRPSKVKVGVKKS